MASTQPTPAGAAKAKGSVSLVSATAIGVGGMMGAGLYTLVGMAAGTAGVWLPLSFIAAGLVASFSVYSYAKLGSKFPSRGGAAQFLLRCFGDGIIAGGLNVFQFLGWIIAMALYASGFAGYAQDLLPWHTDAWVGKGIGVGLIVLVVVINTVGAKLVGRSEQFVIAIELVILLGFVGLAMTKSDWSNFGQTGGEGVLGIFFAAGLLYVCFEGFGVVTNSAGDMKNPDKELPKAMYLSVGIVMLVYILVSVSIVVVMKLADIDANQGHVLAEAGRAVLGKPGFIIVGVAALLATSSAVNATMFGSANLAYMVARDGELPKQLDKHVWQSGNVSLVAAATLTAAFVVFFPLSAVGQMASLAFLIVYGAVSAGHIRVRHLTGANTWLLAVAVTANAGLFALLMYNTIKTKQTATWVTLLAVFALSFVFEVVYRKVTGKSMILQARRRCCRSVRRQSPRGRVRGDVGPLFGRAWRGTLVRAWCQQRAGWRWRDRRKTGGTPAAAGVPVAEGGGFEPPGPVKARRFSRPVHSSALPSFRRPSYLRGSRRRQECSPCHRPTARRIPSRSHPPSAVTSPLGPPPTESASASSSLSSTCRSCS